MLLDAVHRVPGVLLLRVNYYHDHRFHSAHNLRLVMYECRVAEWAGMKSCTLLPWVQMFALATRVHESYPTNLVVNNSYFEAGYIVARGDCAL